MCQNQMISLIQTHQIYPITYKKEACNNHQSTALLFLIYIDVLYKSRNVFDVHIWHNLNM